jgi:CHAD domain-containing protein
MHPAELAILLHRALEVRMARFQERLQVPNWENAPEGLHQVRVAARRLGAVLDLVDPEAYDHHKGQRRTLKRLVSALGPVRELDVHAAALQAQLQASPSPLQTASLEHLLDGLDRTRAKAHRTMTKELAALRLPELARLLKVDSLPHPFQPVSLQEAAWQALAPRLAVLGELQDLGRQENAAALHKGRVQIKKLRYALEALDGAFAAPPEAALTPLRALQTCLGDHHDLAALEAWLWEAEDRLRNQERGMLCSSVLDLLGVIAENRQAAFHRFMAQLDAAPTDGLVGSLRQALGLPPLADPRA